MSINDNLVYLSSIILLVNKYLIQIPTSTEK